MSSLSVISLLLVGTSFTLAAAQNSLSEESCESIQIDFREGSYESLLDCALDHFYNAEWDRAEEIFDRMIERYPNDARAYFYRSMPPFWSYFFMGREPEFADVFLELSEGAINVAENQLEEAEGEEEVALISMLSGLHGYRSLVASRENHIRTALSSGRTGYGYTRSLMEMEEAGPDVLVGRGIYHYMAGNVPVGLRWLASAFGISGDLETGINYLEEAARTEGYLALDARMILAYIYQREEIYPKEMEHLGILLATYPENPLFRFLYAEALAKNGYREEAMPHLRQIVRTESPRFQLLREKSRDRLDTYGSAR